MTKSGDTPRKPRPFQLIRNDEPLEPVPSREHELFRPLEQKATPLGCRLIGSMIGDEIEMAVIYGRGSGTEAGDMMMPERPFESVFLPMRNARVSGNYHPTPDLAVDMQITAMLRPSFRRVVGLRLSIASGEVTHSITDQVFQADQDPADAWQPVEAPIEQPWVTCGQLLVAHNILMQAATADGQLPDREVSTYTLTVNEYIQGGRALGLPVIAPTAR